MFTGIDEFGDISLLDSLCRDRLGYFTVKQSSAVNSIIGFVLNIKLQGCTSSMAIFNYMLDLMTVLLFQRESIFSMYLTLRVDEFNVCGIIR